MSVFGLLALCGRVYASSITFESTITSGVDSEDLFGGGSLIGDAVTLSFVLNQSLLNLNDVVMDGSGNAYLDSYAATGDGAVTGSVAINGDTISATTFNQNSVFGAPALSYCFFAPDCGGGYNMGVNAANQPDGPGVTVVIGSLAAASDLFDSTALSNGFFEDVQEGNIQVCGIGMDNGVNYCLSTEEVFSFGGGDVVPISGGGGSSTPEPAASALFAAGLGGLLACRSLRRT